MNVSIETSVLDAGGRYGIHPSWKPFTGELKYFLFEPDSTEAQRLQDKYAARAGEIEVLDQALNDRESSVRISYFRNRAMSTSCQRNPVVVYYKGERESEPEVVGYRDAPAVTVDGFCTSRGITLDFLKLDTEGTEYLILQGAKQQLAENVIGVRSEVSFDHIFEGMALFSQMHEFMLTNDFFLLNLSYDGRGDHCNEFVDLGGKYGILTGCDAVWLKRQDFLWSRSERVLKYAAFCMNNSASDLAIQVLLQARHQHGLNLAEFKETRLYGFLDRGIHHLFYRLKWQAGQSLQRHQQVYSDIFGKRMLEMHEYNESLELNPD